MFEGKALAVAAALAVGLAGGATALAHPEGTVPNGGEPGPATPDAEGRLLPDLVQIMPGRVDVSTRRSRRGTRTLLAFATAAENHGAGPILIRASRSSTRVSTMTARQVVAHADGSATSVDGVGRLGFHRSSDHSHWHLLDFMRYELRTRSGRTVRSARKTGFCLGDRYDMEPALRWPGEPAAPVFTSRCGLSQPRRVSMSEGISVGYGDDYPARLEGQYIDITGLRTGRYVLVLRVNPTGRLLDLHADNDAASMLVRIVRGRRRTGARILEWCSSSERCPAPAAG